MDWPRIGAAIITDNKRVADRACDDATDDSMQSVQSPDHRSWTDTLAHRWPTALGVGVAGLTIFDMEDGLDFAALTVLMALIYLGAAALDRRWSVWLVLFAGLPLALFIPSVGGIEPAVVLLAAAPVFLVVGAARGLLPRPGGLSLQAAGVLAFGSVVLVALYVDTDVGGTLVGIAILCHAAWDAYHLLKNRVVTRSYAEFCGVFDLLLGTSILVMT